ncbi:MAG: hypothetical protein L6W00_15710 [Lentisphaeria bacterium]|nr:MAG: hypothetical protein L6W00_15710 [Lentisphaeria bacterium]
MAAGGGALPLMLPLRLLPWSLIAWIPFCVALQALDSTPILSRYLRTLVFASLALLWLLPDGDPVELLYLLGPLSILVGINYELGMRRYGFKIRKALILCSAFAVVAALSVGVVCFVPQEWLTPFLSLSNSLDFAASAGYRGWAAVAVLVLLYIAWRLYRGRSARPVWIMLLATSAAAGIFCGAVLTPYRAQADDKREFGRSFRNALRGSRRGSSTKGNILDLYGELCYVGLPVVKIQELDELPLNDRIVYLVDTEFHNIRSAAGATFCRRTSATAATASASGRGAPAAGGRGERRRSYLVRPGGGSVPRPRRHRTETLPCRFRGNPRRGVPARRGQNRWTRGHCRLGAFAAGGGGHRPGHLPVGIPQEDRGNDASPRPG